MRGLPREKALRGPRKANEKKESLAEQPGSSGRLAFLRVLPREEALHEELAREAAVLIRIVGSQLLPRDHQLLVHDLGYL